MEDLVGQQFGNWTVLERVDDTSKSKGAKWLCRCVCGTTKVVFGKYLRNGKSKSCGCTHQRKWVGEVFDKLTVIDTCTENGDTRLVCRCECGNIVTVSKTAIYHTHSCGCSRRLSCVGERYGKLVITEILPNYRNDHQTYVACDCDCGKKHYITKLCGLRTGNTRSCGCIHSPDLTGQKFGKLTVLYPVNSDTHQRLWCCRCECGSLTTVHTHTLTSGHTKSCGCLRTEQTSSMEQYIASLLAIHNIEYLTQYIFDDCVGIHGWQLRFDFYLPTYKVAIEYDGEQHYKPISFFGGDSKLQTQQVNDRIKDTYCTQHNITLLRLPYTMTEDEIKDAVLHQLNLHENPVTTTA